MSWSDTPCALLWAGSVWQLGATPAAVRHAALRTRSLRIPAPCPVPSAPLLICTLSRRYGGLLLAAGGLSLASGDELRLLLSAVAFFVLDRKASVEEAALVDRFGADYAELQRKTKKLIPYIY